MKHRLTVIVLCMSCVLINHDILAQLVMERISILQEFREPFIEESKGSPGRSYLVVNPFLRVANIPSMTEDVMTIDIGDVVVAPYRPRISLRKPLVMGAQSAILIEPGEDTPFLRVTNSGASGTEGVKMFYGDDFPATFVFTVTYDVLHGKEIIDYGNSDSELTLARTYDKATPKLLEKISSGNMGVQSFFDITYDIAMGQQLIGYGDPDFDLLRTFTYDKSTPKLLEKISSDNMGVQSFFDITYDIAMGQQMVGYGDPDFDLLRTFTYDKSTPKLLEKISSDNMGVESFFDITYDIAMGQQMVGYGDPDFDLLRTFTYDKSTPKLLEKISSDNMGVESFFDITYDIALGQQMVGYGDPDFDLLRTFTYDKSTPKLLEKISSNNMGLDQFFDFSYNIQTLTETKRGGNLVDDIVITRTYDKSTPKLSEKLSTGKVTVPNVIFTTKNLQNLSETHEAGDNSQGIIILREYDKATPKLQEKISSYTMGMDNFFLTSYDLPTLTATSKGGDLVENVRFDVTYDKTTPKIMEKISSDNMGVQSFFDISYDIQALTETRRIADLTDDLIYVITYDKTTPQLKNKVFATGVQNSFETQWNISEPFRPTLSMVAVAGGGLAPLKAEVQFDCQTRTFRDSYIDQSAGGLVILEERRMLPDPMTGLPTVALLATGMEVSTVRILGGGGAVSLQSTGDAEINGSLEVTGDLHVDGIFSADTKMFRIDHPLDPEHKYLTHSCVESPDMMNIYNGNITTDASGFAIVRLPEYFEALNCDFRYQLTCIGQFAQAIIAEKIKDNHFIIQTDKPHVEVSWQVTGVRHDTAALKYRKPVEGLKKS